MAKKHKDKYKAVLALLLGVLITASIVSILDVIQGLILDDWSGIHPFNRIYNIVLYVGFSFPMGIILIVLFWCISRREFPLSRYFTLGLMLGLVGVSNLMRPWINIEHGEVYGILFVNLMSIVYFFKKKLKP